MIGPYHHSYPDLLDERSPISFRVLFGELLSRSSAVDTAILRVRLGAVDIAAGNVFGSNMFNLLVLAVDDISYTKGDILTHSQPSQIVPAVLAMVMTAVASAAIIYNPFKRRLPVGLDSVVLGAIFLLNMWLLLSLRAV